MATSLTWIQELQVNDKVLVRDPRTGIKAVGIVRRVTPALLRVSVDDRWHSYYRSDGRVFGAQPGAIPALFQYTDTAESEVTLSQKQVRLLGRMLRTNRRAIEGLTHEQCDALTAALDAAGL